MKHLAVITKSPSKAQLGDAPPSVVLSFLVAMITALLPFLQEKEAEI